MKTYNEIKLAQELIRFPTIKTEDKGIMKFLSKKLTDIGFKCTIIKSKGTGPKPALNLYARYGKSKPHIMYLGHTDVVANLNNWKLPPFKAVVSKGYLNGTQTKFNFVPEQSTDFIFCTIGEEWGFIGSIITVGLFMLLLFRIVILAERQRSSFSRVYGYGVATILFCHFFINIAMTIGIMPVIGIPLPFFSYGGSSLWGFSILLFIFIKLDAYRMDILR